MRHVAYHGTPITGRIEGEPPRSRAALRTLGGNQHDFCVSFYRPEDVEWVDENSREWFGDNGIFSMWEEARKAAEKAGVRFEGVSYSQETFDAYLAWCRRWCLEASGRCKWVVIPDPIGTGTQDLDHMLRQWPSDLKTFGVPVYHLDDPDEGESLDRAIMLLETYGRMCVGAVGSCRVIRSPEFCRRMDDLFNRIVKHFGRVPPIHFFRGLQLLKPECDWPILTADSTDVARNHKRLKTVSPLEKSRRKIKSVEGEVSALLETMIVGDVRPSDHYAWAIRQKVLRWDHMAQARSLAWPPARLLTQEDLFAA